MERLEIDFILRILAYLITAGAAFELLLIGFRRYGWRKFLFGQRLVSAVAWISLTRLPRTLQLAVLNLAIAGIVPLEYVIGLRSLGTILVVIEASGWAAVVFMLLYSMAEGEN